MIFDSQWNNDNKLEFSFYRFSFVINKNDFVVLYGIIIYFVRHRCILVVDNS